MTTKKQKQSVKTGQLSSFQVSAKQLICLVYLHVQMHIENFYICNLGILFYLWVKTVGSKNLHFHCRFVLISRLIDMGYDPRYEKDGRKLVINIYTFSWFGANVVFMKPFSAIEITVSKNSIVVRL